jgi:acyl carrier protein
VSAYEFLAKILSEKYDVDPELISADATWDALGLDSFTIVELIFDVEDEFDIEISEERATFQTLGDAAAVVDECIRAERG